MAIQVQVLKANPFILHNQPLLLARQRALRMKHWLCWHPITSAPGSDSVISPWNSDFLCAAARQCVFPRAPRSQVPHFGESNPWMWLPGAPGAPAVPRDTGHRQGSLSGCHTRGHLTPGVITERRPN